MVKVLIHLGLPKTATTTFQNNIFYALHKKKAINYLGKIQLKGQSNSSFPVQEIVKSILNDDEINFEEKFIYHKKRVKGALNESVVNVLSEERLSLAEQYDLSVVFGRLKRVFEGCHVSVLLFIRNQPDMIYSLYVQMFGYYYKWIENNDTIKKYYENIINDNDDDRYQFNYLKIVGLVKKYFGENDMCVLFYEDLLNDRGFVLKEVAKILNVSCQNMLTLLGDKRLNVKKVANGNYLNDSASLGAYIQKYIKKQFDRYSFFVKTRRVIFDENIFLLKVCIM